MAQKPLKAVILTALSVEFKEVRRFVAGSQQVRHPSGNVYEQGRFHANGREWQVGIVETGAGDSKSARQTERAVNFFEPDVVIFVGVAGGIKDIGIGDVVASTKVYGYESGKAEKKFKPRPEIGLSGFSFIEEAKAEARSEQPVWLSRLNPLPEPPPKLKVGPIAVGEKVVASKESGVYQFLRHNYSDALAVEMEGYGFLDTVNERGKPLPAIVVRGISDLIDNKNGETNQEPEEMRQQKAARHASALAFQLLASYDPLQGITTGAKPQPPQVESPFWNGLFACFQSTELAVLTEALEIVLSASKQAYAFGEIKTFSALQTALIKQNDKKLALDWVDHLICEAQQNAVDQAHGSVLSQSQALNFQAWYDENKPAEVQPLPPTPSPPEQPAYLLISLDPKDDAGTVAFMAELHKPDGQIQTDLVAQGTLCSLEDPEEPLEESEDTLSSLLSDTIRKASKASKVKTIEVFLSFQHLHKPVHQWKAKSGLVIEPLRNFRGTSVRSLDRVMLEFADEWHETLETQLTCLQGCENAALQSRLHEVIELDHDELLTVLEDADPSCLILKFLMVLPEDLQERGGLMSALFQSGIPLWFWAYQMPTNVLALSRAIDELLTADNVKEAATLAEAARKKRKQFPDLGLLFECHTRKPRLPVVTKSDHLRQPAA